MSSDLTPGTVYQFNVVAVNLVGDSPASSTILIMAASVPSAPSVFTTIDSSTTSITISWTTPDNGGDAITDYEIDWNQGDLVNSYTSLVSTTSGTNIHVVNGLTTDGETFRFVVRSTNSIGTSADSTPYAVIAATEPDAPTAFVKDSS